MIWESMNEYCGDSLREYEEFSRDNMEENELERLWQFKGIWGSLVVTKVNQYIIVIHDQILAAYCE